jgi:OmpA-OmpF porin, OOP family
MGAFDTVIGELAGKFGLGAKAGPLVGELLRFVTSRPGGIAGFIDSIKSAGLGNLVTSWLGRGDAAPPMTAPQVEQVLPGNILQNFGSKLGIGSSVVTSALAVAIPKVIGLLTPGGSVPTGVPSTVPAFLDSGAARLPSSAAVQERAAGGMGKWLIPGVIVLALLGLGWYLLTGKPAERVATTPTVTAPAVQPKIALSNDDGVVNVSGVVKDETTRTSILDTLKAAFGVGNVKGDINVDPTADVAAWLGNLKSAVENFKFPGLQALFEGASVSIGGLIPDADRDRIIAQLKSLFGTGVTVAPLSDSIADAVKGAADKTLAALRGLQPGFGGNEVISALNLGIINFASGSAAVPSFNRAVLQQAAVVMKQLPSGTVIQIGGHTDNTGDAAANMQLSQQRADAVRQVLIGYGVDPSTLTAKGYGATQPVASNDTPEGRFQNRRIAYALGS